MKVLVLAEQLAEPATGIGRYTAGVVGAAAAHPALEVTVACTGAGAELAESLGVRADRITRLADPLLVRSATCLTGAGLRRGAPDVIHGTKHFVPLWGPPAVLTVHDLYALDAPGAKGRVLRWGYRRSLTRAAVLAPTNDAVATTLGERLDVDEERLAVYRPARGSAAPIVPEPVAVPEAFALHVSDLDARKNAGLLLDLWPEVHAATGVPLVLVGARHGASRDTDVVERLAAQGSVLDLGPVGDRQLAWLYRHARVLVFPSWSEGWGYPVEEALAAGCPVVTAPVPAVTGRAPEPGRLVVVDPHDRAAWSAAVHAALEDLDAPRPVPADELVGDAAGDLSELYARAVGRAA